MMVKFKRGVSIISLTLCGIVMTLVTTALVLATNNSAVYRYEEAQRAKPRVIERRAYIKVYETYEVMNIARQAFANNYLSFYDKQVDLQGFEALVIGEMMQQIPQNQLEDFTITVTSDRVTVEHK